MNSPRIACMITAVIICLTGQAYCLETFVVNGKAPFAWPSTPADAPRANRIPKEQVQSFINSFDPRHDGIHFDVDEFRFAVLQRNSIALVASVDASGRGLFYNLVGVQPRSDGTWLF